MSGEVSYLSREMRKGRKKGRVNRGNWGVMRARTEMERALLICRWLDLPPTFCQEQVSRRKRGYHDGGGVQEDGREEQWRRSAGVGKMANLANKLSRKLVGNKLEAGFVARVHSSGEKPSVHARVLSSFLSLCSFFFA